MTIPQKFYDMSAALSFTERANFLAIITYYMEYGVIHDEGKGYAFELFTEIRDELDDILRRRRYAREYRARKKAKKQSEPSEKPEQSKKSEPSDKSDTSKKIEYADESASKDLQKQRVFYDTGNLTRRKRRKLESKGFLIIRA